MEFIRRNSDYAFRGLVYLGSLPKRKTFLLSQVARKTQVSEEFLRKLFQKLTQSGILVSRRGKRGGFCLAKDLSKITLLDVMESVQGRVVLNRCQLEEDSCINQRSCKLKRGMQKMHEKLVSFFAKTTISDLI